MFLNCGALSGAVPSEPFAEALGIALFDEIFRGPQCRDWNAERPANLMPGALDRDIILEQPMQPCDVGIGLLLALAFVGGAAGGGEGRFVVVVAWYVATRRRKRIDHDRLHRVLAELDDEAESSRVVLQSINGVVQRELAGGVAHRVRFTPGDEFIERTRRGRRFASGGGHGATSASAIASIAAPNGVEARPCASRRSACRRTSRGQPNCSARLAATAESRALASACEPGLWFWKKISAIRPSGKRETVAV